MDDGRLVSAWIDLDLAQRHLILRDYLEMLEAAHWLRIAELNVSAAADSNEVYLKIAETARKIADRFSEAAFVTHAAPGRMVNVADAIVDNVEELRKNLRAEIERQRAEAEHEEPHP